MLPRRLPTALNRPSGYTAAATEPRRPRIGRGAGLAWVGSGVGPVGRSSSTGDRNCFRKGRLRAGGGGRAAASTLSSPRRPRSGGRGAAPPRPSGRPAGGRAGAFHVPCVSQSPAGPRVRGWAARGSGNGEGEKRCPLWEPRGGCRSVLPVGCARPALPWGGGPPCRPAPPDSALPAAGRAPPQPLSLSRPASQAARDRGLPSGPLLLCPSSNLVSQSRSSHNRPALFPFPYFFLCLPPTCFRCSPPSSGSLPSAFSGCKQQLLHLGVPPLPGP